MKRDLLLHIGLSKTGSSSIQHVLARHRAALLARGDCYPLSPGRVNHALLPASLVASETALRFFHPGVWQGMAPASRLAQFRRDWDNEMAALPPGVARVVLSAEQCGGLLRRVEAVRRLKAMLDPHFDRYRIIVYLRRQDSHIASAYSQFLRTGQLRKPALPPGGPDTLKEYDYAALLDRWAQVFGDAAMAPRIFERDSLVNGDVVDDFLAASGIDLPLDRDDPDRQSNPSIAQAGQALLLRMGRRMAGDQPAGKRFDSAAWRHLGDVVTEALPGRGWRPPRAMAERFLARFAAVNETARRRWFPDRPTLFSPDLDGLPETPVRVGDAALLDAACQVLQAMLDQAMAREVQVALAQARLHERADEIPAALAALRRAVRHDPNALPAQLRLAELNLRTGNRHLAEAHLAAALRLAPEDEAARRLQARLQAG